MIALERAYDYSLAIQYVYHDQSDVCVWEITLYTTHTDWWQSEYSECEESVTDVVLLFNLCIYVYTQH